MISEKAVIKIYWRMEEVCEMLRVSSNTVRNWCKWFKIEPKRNRKGNRLFTRQNIYRMQVIFILSNIEGLTTKGIQRELGL